MEFRINDNTIEGNLVATLGNGIILVKIGGNDYELRLLRASSNELEFILGNTFYNAKILHSTSSEIKLLIDGQPLTIKKHSKLTEILEKSSMAVGSVRSENNLTSQIPGRVVSISAKAGSDVKKGDVVIVLESMKMQVAVKAHKDGSVKEVKVKQGATVSRNDIVAVIE